MKHYLLLDKLKNSLMARFFLGVLPVSLLLLYVVAYLINLFSIYFIIANNNILVGSDYSGTHHRVERVSYNEGQYILEFEETLSREVTADLGDLLFTVYYLDDNWVEYSFGVVCDPMYVHHSVLSAKGYSRNDKICDVYVNNEGSYTLRYPDDKADEVVESIFGVSYADTFKITNQGILKTEWLDLKIVDCLKTDDIYYDINSDTLVRNVVDDFAINLILDNKLFIVLIAGVVFMVLAKYFNWKKVLVSEVISISFISLCFVLTFIFLKGW